MPVMGVWGEGDVALAERQMIASAELRHRVLALRAGRRGTHWLQLEAPDTTNRLLLDYLR